MSKIYKMCNREVVLSLASEYSFSLKKQGAMYKGQYLLKCADCGAPTKFIVTEIGPLNNETNPRVWAWCGVCEIG